MHVYMYEKKNKEKEQEGKTSKIVIMIIDVIFFNIKDDITC